MNNSRRRFIQSGLGGSALISLSGAVPNFLLGASVEAAKNRQEKILVVVELNGGNDGLNTVIPFADPEYYRNRFTLAIEKDQVLKIDDQVGLHPSMNGFAKLLEAEKLAVVQGVGYSNPNRSHFESMDLWHTAHQVGQRQTGWIGRMLEENEIAEQLPAIHFGTSQQPLAVKSLTRPSPSIRTIDDFQLSANARAGRLGKLLKPMINAPRDSSHELLTFVHENAKVALDTSERLESIAETKSGNTKYPATQLGRDLQSVSRLIDSGLPTRIYYVTRTGFDTHSNQREAHAGLLADVSSAITAFVDDIDQQGNGERVAVMSFSEFGRRVRENASGGTDHGTAAPMFMIGSGVNAGTVGDHPSLTDLDDGDLKFSIDYRSVYAEVLENWLGVEAEAVIGKGIQSTRIFSK
jgi:uncharacterized protein (DUF1501 family)